MFIALPFDALALKNTDDKTAASNSLFFKILSRIIIISCSLYSANLLAVQSEQTLNGIKSFNLVTAIYPPYNYQDDDGIKGLNIEVIKAAFSAVGYQLNVEILPFGRAFQYAKQGTMDGITLWHSKERIQWFEFSNAFTHSELVFLKSTSRAIKYQSLNDLIPFTIGTVQNYAYPKSFSNHHGIKTDQVLTDEQNINKLVLGRIDIALIDMRMAKFILRKNHPEQQHAFNSAGILKNESYYLAVSKNSRNYKQKLKAFNLGLTIIKDNGVLEEIISRYN